MHELLIRRLYRAQGGGGPIFYFFLSQNRMEMEVTELDQGLEHSRNSGQVKERAHE